jgi:hypothetical protein
MALKFIKVLLENSIVYGSSTHIEENQQNAYNKQ